MYVNLIPPAVLNYLLIRKRLRQWGRVWVIAVLAGLAMGARDLLELQQDQRALGDLRLQVEPIQKAQQVIRDCDAQVQRIQQEIEVLTQMQSPDRSLSLLSILSAAVKSTEKAVQVQRLNFVVGTRQSSPPVAATSTVTLQGIARGDAALAEFVEGLRGVNVFDKVELRSSSQFHSPEINGRQFQLGCAVRE